MTTERPKVKRSYVTVTDPDTRESKHLTVYGSTPEQVVAALKTIAGNEKPVGAGRRSKSA